MRRAHDALHSRQSRRLRVVRRARHATSHLPPLWILPHGRQLAEDQGIGAAEYCTVKIALDAMGGDLAPKATVEGAVLAARDFGIEVVMVGDGEILARELADHDAANLPIRIEHAPEVVLMDDSPLYRIRAVQATAIVDSR